ncbi:hypothetical protein SO802_012378 [Lithocarpus litseifolius]|uniref:RNase H type-1 domain-containing protein n=1 Tax=Lithocarpus litseifolius TaxID=425828 RepID=A0AAW2D4Q8_9ROSI
MEWRADLICQNFMPQDVDATLSIPLSAHRARDKLILAGTKNGKFSVRSAYKMAQEATWGGKGAEPSDPTVLTGIWRCGLAHPERKDHCPGLSERIIAICWGIWKNRNEVRHGDKGRAGREITRSSLSLLEEFQTVNEGLQATRMNAPEVVKWLPPRPGCYKVNVDGAVFSKRKQVGIGVVIRDSLGEVVAALSKKMALPLGALETAKALEEGIQFVSDVGVRDVIFEGDSMNICNSVQGLSEPPSSVQNIIAGILRRVQSFRTFKFTHTKRQGNVPAHLLAQHAANVEVYSAWLEECPSLIVHACEPDVRTLLTSE